MQQREEQSIAQGSEHAIAQGTEEASLPSFHDFPLRKADGKNLGPFSAREIDFEISVLALGMNSDMPSIVSKRPEKEKSDHRAVDALYRISAFASSQPDPKLALEGILDEVMNVFDASSASICLLDANSDKLSIEVERPFRVD